MPALAGLISRGVRGNLATMEPMISPMLWTTIATGRTADCHGVLGFVEPKPGGHGVRPWSSRSRRCRAIWNILHREGRVCQTAGWWASHPAEPLRGTVVSRAFLDSPAAPDGRWTPPPGSVHPPSAAERLAPCRLHPHELTGDDLAAFVPDAAHVCQESDRSLAVLAGILSSTATMQALALELLREPDRDFTAVYFDGLDHACHAFMPYHPPRRSHIPEDRYRLYRDVVRNICRLLDRMLAFQLQAAGPDTTVVLCSDHGFLCGDSRPLTNPGDPCGPTLWHRDTGILVMAGPGVRQGEVIHGAGLPDIAPTLLALAGLPAGRDMPGRVLEDALEFPAPPRIESWESVEGDDGSARSLPDGSPEESGSAGFAEHLVALGYLEDPRDAPDAGAETARVEAEYNLCQVLLSTSRAADAVPRLAALLKLRPGETRFVHQLANALVRSSRYRECMDLLLQAYPETDGEVPPPVVLLLLARACHGLNDVRGARFYARQASRRLPRLPGPWTELADIFVAVGRPQPAAAAYRKALEIDPEFAPAWNGLAGLRLQQRRWTDALDAAAAATRLVHHLPAAHLRRGIALLRLHRTGEARTAFQTAAAMAPADPAPWRWLAALPARNPEDEFVRAACREQARRLFRARVAHRRARMHESQRPKPEIPVPVPPGGSAPPGERAPRTLTIVSGVPRSGTSMLMRMLDSGGLPARTDGVRAPDPDNPDGYFEWEPVKSLPRNPGILADPALAGQAVKVVSALLPSLPATCQYRVLFILRDPDEVARSQIRMLRRGGRPAGTLPDASRLADAIRQHTRSILGYLQRRPGRFDLLTLDYAEVCRDPVAAALRIRSFLGEDSLPYPDRAAAVVRSRSVRTEYSA